MIMDFIKFCKMLDMKRVEHLALHSHKEKVKKKNRNRFYEAVLKCAKKNNIRYLHHKGETLPKQMAGVVEKV